mgnify:CR=1 FL=1
MSSISVLLTSLIIFVYSFCLCICILVYVCVCVCEQSARTHAETHGPWARFVPSAAGAASTATSSSSAAGYGVRDPSSDVLTSAGGVRGALAPWANGPRALVLSELARANGVHELYKVFRKKTDSFIRRNAYNEFENWLLTLRAKAAATTAGAAVAKALTVTETAPRADGDDDDDDSAAAVESVNEFDEDVEGDGRAIALGANGGMPDPERRKTRSFALATAGAALVPAKASDPKEKLRNAAAMAAAGATIGIAPLTQPSLALSDPLLPATEAVATDVGLGTRLVAAGATPQEAAEVCRVLSSRYALKTLNTLALTTIIARFFVDFTPSYFMHSFLTYFSPVCFCHSEPLQDCVCY